MPHKTAKPLVHEVVVFTYSLVPTDFYEGRRSWFIVYARGLLRFVGVPRLV